MGRRTLQRFGVESIPDVHRYGTLAQTSWMLDPAPSVGPSFMVSLVARDRPGVVHAMLGELVDVHGSSDGETRGPWSVTAALCASHSDVGVVVLVVRPPVVPASGTERWSSGVRLQERLEAAIRRAGVPTTPPHTELRVEPLGGDNEKALFDGRTFGEVRFGPLVAEQSTSRGIAATVARTLTSFTARLRDLDVPIAFFDIGHRWHPRRDDEAPDRKDPRRDSLWLRVAYGLPSSPVTRMQVELAAVDVALDIGLDVHVHEPHSDESGLRFVPLVDRHAGGHLTSEIRGATRCVVVEGFARVGFVAAVLEAAQTYLGDRGPLLVYGGSMMVLHGRSVIALLTDEDGERALKEGVRHAERQVGGFKSFLVEPSSAESPSRMVNLERHESLWVAWWSKDRAGVFYDVLDTAISTVARHNGERPNVLFAVTRRLEVDDTCAGKVKLHLPGVRVDDEWVGLLRRHLEDVDLPAGRRVIVSLHEPNQYPWAALDKPVQAVLTPGGDEDGREPRSARTGARPGR